MNRYENPANELPLATGARRAMGMAAGPGAGVEVVGIEVTQAVQDLQNSVRLIADKPTIVRVYLKATGPSAPFFVTGELSWRRAGTSVLLPAFNRIQLDAAVVPTLAQQRGNLDLSLNFRLPTAALADGAMEISFSRAVSPGGSTLPIAGAAKKNVTFVTAPPLRLRVVGLRWRRPGVGPGSGSTVAPDAIHFSMLRSFLLRAYPISKLEWSQIVVDADVSFQPPFIDGTSDLANMQLMALRSRDIAGGFDARTRYYGLVANLPDDVQNTTMRGSAVLNNATRVFGKVASGPAGKPDGWTGDFDLSFADWYGAHELGHTCQRFHPGFPPPGVAGGQDRSDLNFPYANGLISPPGGEVAGFDVGDPDLNVGMRPLPGHTHHDIMTYENDQWVSPYTYHAIFDQLLREEATAGIPLNAMVAGAVRPAARKKAAARKMTEKGKGGAKKATRKIAKPSNQRASSGNRTRSSRGARART